MPRRKSLRMAAFFAIATSVCLCFYLVMVESVEKKKSDRDPFITAPLFDQWEFFPSFMPGMDGGDAPTEAPVIGSVPRIDGYYPTKFKEELFDAIVVSSGNRTLGIVNYPNDIAFNKVPMCYCSYSGTGELQWMVHAGDHGDTLSVGTFLAGTPDDGFFLLDTITGKVILHPDISDYFKGRDLPPPLGIVELINGRVVGMISLQDTVADKLVAKYLETKPGIHNCLTQVEERLDASEKSRRE